MITRLFLKLAFRIRAKYFKIPDTFLNCEYKHRKRFTLWMEDCIDFTKRLIKGRDIEYSETWGNTRWDDKHAFKANNVRWCTSFGLVRFVSKYEINGVDGWYLKGNDEVVNVTRDYSSGMLRFIEELEPGYMYSFRFQCADFVGSWTALWLHKQYGDGDYLEFDILEQFYKDKTCFDEIQINAQYGTVENRKHLPLKIKGFPFSHKPFDIDMLWLEDLIEIYINGIKVYRLKNHKFIRSMTLMAGVAVHDFGNGCERAISDKNAILYHINKYQVL